VLDMSKETRDWLNANTLVGFTANKDVWAGNGFMVDGKPWWHMDGFTGAFEQGVPVETVLDRLFYWTPLEGDLTVRIPQDDVEFADGIDANGIPYLNKVVEGKKAIIRPDTETVLGIFGADTYQVHNYEKWLIDNVGAVLDAGRGELGISSAGLLRGGGVAYVTIELPETVVTASGDGIRPAIIATTSLDGTKATTYVVRAMRPVCDNSLDLTLMGSNQKVKIKHSSQSMGRIGEVRDGLGLLYQATADMVTFLDRCAETTVTTDQFQQIVASLVPKPDPQVSGGKVQNQRSITNAENRTDELWRLWRQDPRVGNLSGTLAGAYQAVNTWTEHMRTRNDNGVERLMMGTIDGTFTKADAEFWKIVQGLDITVPVLAAAA
jgi:phage/plasmid-like protein (TIGR03299 family)